MGGFGEDDRWRDAMFENGNRVHFERPVEDAGRQWWLEAFFDPHDLSPEGMGDLLTQSVTSDKSIIYRFIDGVDHSFALRVQGRFHGGGEVWFVERTFRLEGAIFSADEMFVAAKDAEAGRGRLLMNDLFVASKLLGVARIDIEAQRIGRYAWLRIGFVPDLGSWRNIQLEAPRFIQRHQPHLGNKTHEFISRVLSGTPKAARWLAGLRNPVPSRELFDADGHPLMVPLGKAFFIEASPNWTGEFSFDPESVAIAESICRELEMPMPEAKDAVRKASYPNHQWGPWATDPWGG